MIVAAALISGEMLCRSRPQISNGSVFSRPDRKNLTSTSSKATVKSQDSPGQDRDSDQRARYPPERSTGRRRRSADASSRFRGNWPSLAST